MSSPGKTYTNILVIGNGFDLNLGLKTSYRDFLKSEQFDKLVYIGKNSLCEYLREKHNLNLWIDIENELKTYSRMQHERFEQDFENLCTGLMDYLKNLDYSQINWDSEAYNLIKQIKNQEFLILDFNYTESVKKILTDLNYPVSQIDDRIIKIHGSVKQGNIIFGIEDQAQVFKQHIFLKKTFNLNYKPIQFKHLLDSAKSVYFFGHSLGETDHMYFQSYFMGVTSRVISNIRTQSSIADDLKSISLYYFGKIGYKEIHMQLDELTLNHIGLLKQNIKFNQIDVSKHV